MVRSPFWPKRYARDPRNYSDLFCFFFFLAPPLPRSQAPAWERTLWKLRFPAAEIAQCIRLD